MCGRACMGRIHARPHVLGSLREGSASCLAGSAVRMTRDLGLAERAQTSECGVARRSWLEGDAMEVQVATDASAATQAFALG